MLYVITYDISHSNEVADKLSKYSPYDTIGAVIYKKYIQKLLKTSTPITDITSIKDEYCTVRKATIEDVESYVIDGPGKEETIEFLKKFITHQYYFKANIYDEYTHINCKHIMCELYRLGKYPKLIYAKEDCKNHHWHEIILCINSDCDDINIKDRHNTKIILDKFDMEEEIVTFDFEFETRSFDDKYWVGRNQILNFAEKVNTISLSIKDGDLKSPITYRTSFILTDENKNIFEGFYNDNKSNIKIL